MVSSTLKSKVPMFGHPNYRKVKWKLVISWVALSKVNPARQPQFKIERHAKLYLGFEAFEAQLIEL